MSSLPDYVKGYNYSKHASCFMTDFILSETGLSVEYEEWYDNAGRRQSAIVFSYNEDINLFKLCMGEQKFHRNTLLVVKARE